MATFLKFTLKDPCNSVFYSVKNVYTVAEERRKAVVCIANVARNTTKPDIEIRYQK